MQVPSLIRLCMKVLPDSKAEYYRPHEYLYAEYLKLCEERAKLKAHAFAKQLMSYQTVTKKISNDANIYYAVPELHRVIKSVVGNGNLERSVSRKYKFKYYNTTMHGLDGLFYMVVEYGSDIRMIRRQHEFDPKKLAAMISQMAIEIILQRGINHIPTEIVKFLHEEKELS